MPRLRSAVASSARVRGRNESCRRQISRAASYGSAGAVAGGCEPPARPASPGAVAWSSRRPRRGGAWSSGGGRPMTDWSSRSRRLAPERRRGRGGEASQPRPVRARRPATRLEVDRDHVVDTDGGVDPTGTDAELLEDLLL